MWSFHFVTAELGSRLSDTAVLPERHIYGRIYCVWRVCSVVTSAVPARCL